MTVVISLAGHIIYDYFILYSHNLRLSVVSCKLTPIVLSNWAVPENIHATPRTAFRNSEGKGGFFELEIRRHGGILTIGIPKAWGGGLDLGFPQETDKSVFLEKANFMDF